MLQKEITVKPTFGLYNNKVTYFVQKANEFKSSLWVQVEDRKVNAKSLLGVVALGVDAGIRLTLIANGIDEEQAMEALNAILSD